MKLKDLKTYETSPTYKGRGEGSYDPIPHYDLVKAVKESSSFALKFSTKIEEKTSSMVATAVAVATDDVMTPIAPAMLLMSSHTGRQSAEAVFGHLLQSEDKPPLFMVTCNDSVTRRHRGAEGDLSSWSDRVAAKFAQGHNLPGRTSIKKWWNNLKRSPVTAASALALINEFVGLTSGRVSKQSPPLGKRTGALSVLEVMAADEDNLGMTVAGLLVAAGRIIDKGDSPLVGVYRKISLFRRLGDNTPPDAYGDA